MASIAEKKAILSLSDGASVNLNKPIDIPDSVTDIIQIKESGWYHGTFTFKTWTVGGVGGLGGAVGGVGNTSTDKSTVSNTPAMKIKDSLTVDTEYNFDVFVTKTGDYIFNLAGHLFYGVIQTNDSITSINWEIVSPNDTSSDAGAMKAPKYSTTDLTPGVSSLADGQIYIVYYN